MTDEIKAALSEGDTIIFRCDEWRDGRMCEFDGHVQGVRENGVDVLYLSGYRSRNNFIEWKDIIAKVDLSKPCVRLKDAPFSGHFHVFSAGGGS